MPGSNLSVNGGSVLSINQQVGYSNTNSFIRTFKKYEGISPGEYAKTND